MWTAWRDGVRRVSRAPGLLGATWLIAALLAAPIAMTSRVDFSPGLPGSGRTPADVTFAGRVLDELRAGTLERAVEFGGGVSQVIDGFDEFTAFVDYESRWMVSLVVSYPFVMFWVLLSGGAIDRYARDRTTGAFAIGSASAGFLLRFIRFGLVFAATYAVAFRAVGKWPVILTIVLAACNLVFDYAQVRMVVEDRQSVLGSLVAAVSFIRRNFVSSAGLYVINWATVAAITAAYVVVGPGSGFRFGPDRPIGWTIATWIVVNQLYVVGRLWARLVFWASATSLFQSRLAHAGYIARPVPRWPDSPSAEAIRNLVR